MNAMAEFLRVRRGRIGPADVGLPTGPGARRTPGLRREELAALAANPEGLALMPGLGDWPPGQRNTIRYTFLHPAARTVFADWDRVARNSVAHLHSAEPAAPERTAALVAELSAADGGFAALWRRHEVWVKRGGRTAFRHPVIGPLTLANEVLGTADGQRMLVYQAAPGTTEHDALVLLAMTAEDVGSS